MFVTTFSLDRYRQAIQEVGRYFRDCKGMGGKSRLKMAGSWQGMDGVRRKNQEDQLGWESRIHQGFGALSVEILEPLLAGSDHPNEITHQQVLVEIINHPGDPALRTPEDCHKNHI